MKNIMKLALLAVFLALPIFAFAAPGDEGTQDTTVTIFTGNSYFTKKYVLCKDRTGGVTCATTSVSQKADEYDFYIDGVVGATCDFDARVQTRYQSTSIWHDVLTLNCTMSSGACTSGDVTGDVRIDGMGNAFQVIIENVAGTCTDIDVSLLASYRIR